MFMIQAMVAPLSGIFFKGAQAWDIRRRVFYTIQACMGRW
jgi:hypothetical protein